MIIISGRSRRGAAVPVAASLALIGHMIVMINNYSYKPIYIYIYRERDIHIYIYIYIQLYIYIYISFSKRGFCRHGVLYFCGCFVLEYVWVTGVGARRLQLRVWISEARETGHCRVIRKRLVYLSSNKTRLNFMIFPTVSRQPLHQHNIALPYMTFNLQLA